MSVNVEINFQEAIQNGYYTATGKIYETCKYSCLVYHICLHPYKRVRFPNGRVETIYGEAQEFNYDHPDFLEMLGHAEVCPHGLHSTVEKISEHNLEDFSRAVLGMGIENPMSLIKKAIELVSERNTIRTQMRAVQRAAAKRNIEQ